MPKAAVRPCSHPSCSTLTQNGRCDQHKRAYEQQRGGSTERGYTYRWQQARQAFLTAHPLCQCPECMEGSKRVMQATVVDHHIPHRGDMTLFWDSTNWRAMSKECHDRKTASQDGGWGNLRIGGGVVEKQKGNAL